MGGLAMLERLFSKKKQPTTCNITITTSSKLFKSLVCVLWFLVFIANLSQTF